MDSTRAFWLGIFETLLLQKSICGKCSLLVQVWMRSFFTAPLLASSISYTGPISFKLLLFIAGGVVGWMWHSIVDISHHWHRSNLTGPLLSDLFYLPSEWCCFLCRSTGDTTRHREILYSRPYRVQTGPVLTPSADLTAWQASAWE